MRLKDFKEFVEKYGISDDTILDGIMFADILPGYYDGYPTEVVDWSVKFSTEQKIRFYRCDVEDVIGEHMPFDTIITEDAITNWIETIRDRIIFDPRFPPNKIRQYKSEVEQQFQRVAFNSGINVTERRIWND